MNIHALKAQTFTGNKHFLIPTVSGRTEGILCLAGLSSVFAWVLNIGKKTNYLKHGIISNWTVVPFKLVIWANYCSIVMSSLF